MEIYILLFIYVILICILFKKNKKLQIVLIGIPLIMLTGFRSIYLGLNDTSGTYLNLFKQFRIISFENVFQQFKFNEPLFYLSFKIITDIFKNYRVLLFIYSIPFIVVNLKFIYDNSDNMILSIIYFISMYFLINFYLIKQCIALCIIIMSYKFIKDKKPIKFILTVFLASLFHKSAIVFIIAYPFCNYIKFGIKNYFIIIIVSIIGILAPNIILNLIAKFDYTNKLIWYLKNGIYLTGTKSLSLGLLVQIAILIYCKCVSKKEENNIYLSLLTLGCCAFSLMSVVVEFYRISFYFMIFSTVPVSYRLKNKKINSILQFSFCLVMILYFLFISSHNYNANPYIFYWEAYQ